MSLAALVAAYDVAAYDVGHHDGAAQGGEGRLRALSPLAGATLVEHQLRRLASAGVTRFVLLVEDWPAALQAPLQRLRAERMIVDVATSAADAADRLAGEARLLLIADGCLPGRALVERMAGAGATTLATLADAPAHEAFERIDADTRWAGVATIDGDALAGMAAMVGDWDPVSTLLRRAVQHGAARIDAGDDTPILAGQAGGIAAAQAQLIAGSRGIARGWADRFIESPLAGLVLPRLFVRALSPDWIAMAAPALAILSGIAALAGHPAIGLGLILPSGVLRRLGERLALIQARTILHGRMLRYGRLGGMALGALGLGGWLRHWEMQWGWLLMAALPIAALAGCAVLRPLTEPETTPEDWPARPSAMPWLLLPFALAGHWGWGLGVATLYATGSLGWAIRRIAHTPPR